MTEHRRLLVSLIESISLVSRRVVGFEVGAGVEFLEGGAIEGRRKMEQHGALCEYEKLVIRMNTPRFVLL